MKPIDAITVPLTKLENDLIRDAEISLHAARFDLIHPVVSGNKLFKLHYFLEDALQTDKPVLTFGGPWSNHLAATAFACRELNIPCRAIVNGLHQTDTPTLQFCRAQKMELEFVSKEKYRDIKYEHSLENFIVIPEGGFHPTGVKGAAKMWDHIAPLTPTHTCLSAGSATTLAGMLSAQKTGRVIAVPAIKNMEDIPDRLQYLRVQYVQNELEVWPDYHFGGFAKTTPELVAFMKNLYEAFGIATDMVYTAKLFFAVMDQIQKGYFPKGSRVVCIHSGGLQGNASNPNLPF